MKPVKTILIADDDPQLIEVVSDLAGPNFHVITALSGPEALNKIERLVPAIVLLDVVMPGIDGFEVCQKVRSLHHLNGVRIIFMTGQADLEKRLKGYSIGCNDYITKPFNRAELLAKISVYATEVDRELQFAKANEELSNRLKQQSDDLLKRERLAHVGLHVAEVVHNLKGPLSIIPHYIEQLADSTERPEITPKLHKAVNKLNSMIDGIMHGVRGRTNRFMTGVNINNILMDELEWLKLNDFLKYKVEIVTDFAELPLVQSNPNDLAQVFGNILKNAVEALTQVKNPKIVLTTRKNEQFVETIIADNGPGIADRVLPHIFEAHFSTKGDQNGSFVQGTGLGLAYCKKMVEEYGGSITVRSKRWKGATFIVSLPIMGDKVT